MDKTSYENWVRVKEMFEESGNTDNFYYKRACVIVNGSPDPLDRLIDKKKLQDGPQDEGNQTNTSSHQRRSSEDD